MITMPVRGYLYGSNRTALIADFLLPRVKKLDQAKDGKEGLELYKTNKHDVIVTDIKMPVMNGFEMSRAIKLINKEIPIIITTAYNDTELLIESIEIGVRQFILKPIITAKLFESIKKCAESLKK
jgi:YesN/AraC family two-component response regulator